MNVLLHQLLPSIIWVLLILYECWLRCYQEAADKLQHLMSAVRFLLPRQQAGDANFTCQCSLLGFIWFFFHSQTRVITFHTQWHQASVHCRYPGHQASEVSRLQKQKVRIKQGRLRRKMENVVFSPPSSTTAEGTTDVASSLFSLETVCNWVFNRNRC